MTTAPTGQSQQAPLLLMAAGGTGGHMFPAQALAEEMLRRGWRVKLSTDERGARYTGGFPDAVEIEELPSATFARGGVLAKAVAPFRILSGVAGALFAFRRERPSVVVGFGGYPSIPAMAAAWLTGVPRMIHEQNGVLGRVNQIFAPRVSLVACGMWPTDLPEGAEGRHTGNPVRRAVLERTNAPYIPPGDYPLSVLVMGGSQGARILSDVVPEALSGLPEGVRTRLRVSHQARAEDHARVSAYYAEQGISADVQPFFTDIPIRMAEAQLVISRAGASSIADISVIGRPSVLVPYALAAADHQSANARGLAAADAAIVIPESRLDSEMLGAHIASVLTNPDAAVLMARAAAAAGRPEAVQNLAGLVEHLADPNARPVEAAGVGPV